MGIDLNIVIANGTEKAIKEVGFFPFNKMYFDRDYELFEEIKELNIKKCDFKVMWYTDTGIEYIDEDPYGSALTYTRAGEFSKIGEREKYSKWNREILRFLDDIDSNEIVVLYWC